MHGPGFEGVGVLYYAVAGFLWFLGLWTVFASPKFRNKIGWALVAMCGPVGSVIVLLVALFAPRRKSEPRVRLTGL
jgi:hypothetical protein